MKINILQKSIIWALVLFFAFSLCSVLIVPAMAETDYSEIYTDVMEDLEKDKNFDKNEYERDFSADSFKFITIGESDAKEVFVYLFQGYNASLLSPIPAVSIRISTSEDLNNPTPKDYTLTLLSHSDGFMKYKVNGLTVKNSKIRYYQIIQVERAFNSLIDNSSGVIPMSATSTSGTVAYAVNQNWKAETQSDGTVLYSWTYFETITITDRFDGSILYPIDRGFWLWDADTNVTSHFVAFSTDRKMDSIVDADITFYSVEYVRDLLLDRLIYLEETRTFHELTLRDIDSVSYEEAGIFGRIYSWKRIQTVSEFLEQEEKYLTTDAYNSIKEKSFVFRFCESEYTEFLEQINGSEVSEVTILRIKFICDGAVYNMGVVNNRVTPDLVPDGSHDEDNIFDGLGDDASQWLKELWEKIEKFLSLVLVVLLLGIIVCFCPWIFTLLWFVIKIIFWVISLPFRLIALLFKKKDKK